MPTPMQTLLADRDVDLVTVEGIEAFLAGYPEHAALVFSGETKRRPEAQDVAVATRELKRAYRGAVRLGVVDGAAEDKLKTRFGVVVLPTIVLLRGGAILATIPRIRDWSEYADFFRVHFGPPPALAAE